MATDFLSLLTAVPSLISDFSGSTADPYGKDKKALAQKMSQLADAQGDTNNPLYKQIYGQYQDQNRQNLAQTIAEAQGQNRMNTANGRTPLFDPSRGGEQLFRGLIQGQQAGAAQSAQQAQAALQERMTGYGNAYATTNNAGQGAGRGNAQNMHGYTQLTDLLRGASQPNKPQIPATPISPYAPLSGGSNPFAQLPNSYGISGGWGGY